MAEGGGEEDLDNPFSFTTYVKKKTKQQDDQDINTDDIFSVPKKEKQSLVITDDIEGVSGDETSLSKTKKKGNKENPFSFKKFLGQSGQKDNDCIQKQRAPPGTDSFSRTGSAAAQISSPNPFGCGPSPVLMPSSHHSHPPDFASDLPDFIQNHFSDNAVKSEGDRRKLPDFTLRTEGGARAGGGSRPRKEDGAVSVVASGHENNLVDTIFFDDDHNSDSGAQRGRQLSLPDFLVDSAMPSAGGHSASEDSKDKSSVRTVGGLTSSRSTLPALPPLADSVDGARLTNGSDLSKVSDGASSLQVNQLREENQQLHATVMQMRQRARDEETRVAGLEKEIARLQKKEAEETAVMERAVQQVEENLVATTTRAVKAETMVTKLKTEVKALQGQVKALTLENQALSSGDKGLADVRERTKYASEQLATAASAAENNLKELLRGVEKLKLLGQVLDSLEKFGDADNSSTQDSPGTS